MRSSFWSTGRREMLHWETEVWAVLQHVLWTHWLPWTTLPGGNTCFLPFHTVDYKDYQSNQSLHRVVSSTWFISWKEDKKEIREKKGWLSGGLTDHADMVYVTSTACLDNSYRMATSMNNRIIGSISVIHGKLNESMSHTQWRYMSLSYLAAEGFVEITLVPLIINFLT